jgi:ATP-dependent protease ClpP protease subunit
MLKSKLEIYMDNPASIEWISLFISIGVLCIFEVLKRKVFAIFSADYVTNRNKITGTGLGFAIGSLIIIAGSYYFSINGALKLANSSETKNEIVKVDFEKQTDSLTIEYSSYKKSYIADNDKLREANTELRNRISELPPTSRTTINNLNAIIKDNLKTIEFNNAQVDKLDKELQQKIALLKEKETEESSKNTDSDRSSVIVFFSITTIIELLIVIGIFYREVFNYKTFQENEPKLEMIYKKKERYAILLKYAFKKGEIHQDQKVISASRLYDLTKVAYGSGFFAPKNIDDFYAEMTHLGVFKIVQKKRYAAMSYEESLRLLDKLHDVDDNQ